ncbi:MAG: 16S rRNA (adenine(1518)-N(6)/adenine(1519)-N(6))-dimethyltransferase RsmA [Bryobacteraceae bacterium]|nr:16S rRNA (adenine(1518)-N(6)/adenine(1519)-N(6))-dimethyltransferase RsmA [Bryobacteraceae bacterium]
MPRRLGQHFLIRTSILRRIAEAAVPSQDLHVLEIGPGRGALTQFLVPAADRVTAVEVDPVLVHYLQEKFRGEPNFSVIHADVLQTDLAQWGPVAVAGNLPYYITSPIVEKVLGLGPLLRRAVFLVQKEVGERITAQPGSRDYGYLSAMCQVAAEVKYIATVPPGAFRPPPKVDSAVVQLVPRESPLVEDRARFLGFASLCFVQKRKTLRNNLVAAYPGIEAEPEAKLRAEQVGIEQMVDLWRRLGGHP